MDFEINVEMREKLSSNGIFPITNVSFESIDALTKWIMNNRPRKNGFTILINSSGGTPAAIIKFASFICTLQKDVKITGVAFDTCGSAALALLQCCHIRIAVKHCAFFIHHIQSNLRVNCQKLDLKKIKLELASSRLIEDEVVKIQCERSGMKRKKWMTLADYGENDIDTPILAEKALELGLIDKILPKFPCF